MSGSARHLTVFAFLVLVGTACESAPEDDLGPLAVVDFGGGGASLAAGGTGEVRISDDCVSVVLDNGQTVLPVWHQGDAEWDEDDRSIHFGPEGDAVVIHAGDRVALGGESLEDDDPSLRGDIPWVKEPAEGCAGERFLVDQVVQK